MTNSSNNNRPIGFFDSGVGGLSVLKQAITLLPRENFVYFGDSKNAPYGTRSVNEVKKLTFDAVDFLLTKKVKALVIACNTATSAAIEDIRKRYSFMPVIGIEPALKPAVELRRRGKIIIMATPVTLSEKKFNNLVIEYGKAAEIEPLPCPGLAELIERGVIEGEELHKYLLVKLNDFLEYDIAAIVLGCTHYPFIINEIKKIIGNDVPIIDGSIGTSKQLRRQLLKHGIMNDGYNSGRVEILNSSDNKEMINLSYNLLGL
jgi:glutamate racemase